jgi:hypothetical protein
MHEIDPRRDPAHSRGDDAEDGREGEGTSSRPGDGRLARRRSIDGASRMTRLIETEAFVTVVEVGSFAARR